MRPSLILCAIVPAVALLDVLQDHYLAGSGRVWRRIPCFLAISAAWITVLFVNHL